MARHPTHNPRLWGDRDYEILDHVRRYRLTTPEILHRLFFADSERNAVTKVTSRLCELEFLQSHQLYASYTYFTLGRRGAKVVSISSNKLGPLGHQALYKEYGTLIFCCRSEAVRERLTLPEVMRQFPQLISGRMDASHYYLDHENGVDRLGYIWVEAAGTVEHVVTTAAKDIIEQRRMIPAVRDLIDQGQFMVSIVTLTEDKQLQIVQALKKVLTPVFFRVEVVPELIHLIPSFRHA